MVCREGVEHVQMHITLRCNNVLVEITLPWLLDEARTFRSAFHWTTEGLVALEVASKSKAMIV